MEALTRLRKQSSVEEYKCKFEALSNRLRGLSEAYKLSCFSSVLKEEIKLLRMFNSNSLLVAYGLGKIPEEHVLNGRRNWRSPNVTMPNMETFNDVAPNVNQSSSGPLKAMVPVQKISPAQMEERREK